MYINVPVNLLNILIVAKSVYCGENKNVSIHTCNRLKSIALFLYL